MQSNSLNYPAIRVVFDRKHLASKTKVGLVQLEVLFNGKRKYITTGVKVYKDQWHPRDGIKGRPDATILNKRIAELRERIDGYVVSLIKNNSPFSFDALDRWLAGDNEKQVSFIDWAAKRIEERRDIKDSTRGIHRQLVSALRKFGRIVNFQDLTRANIVLYDDWLQTQGKRQTTISSYHAVLKTYINEAIKRELVRDNPYLGVRIDRGRSEWGRFLSPEELQLIERTKMPTEKLAEAKDLFLMQCYTGLAYSDVIFADFSKAVEMNGQMVMIDERRKTGVQYTSVLIPKALKLLSKWKYKLPKLGKTTYNDRLKVVAQICGIPKPIASHYGRRTCGMILLNEGFPIEIVARVLGHANIKTTQEAYARILDKTVAAEFAKRQK